MTFEAKRGSLGGEGEIGEMGEMGEIGRLCRGGFHYYLLKWCVTLR